ncbi:hypothetical protein SRHO_G00255490 [Serrasalmus rhombeus]
MLRLAVRTDLSRCAGVMLTFFREEWEMEGLQTVGILLIVCSSLKLLHFLGLIDFSAGVPGIQSIEQGNILIMMFNDDPREAL